MTFPDLPNVHALATLALMVFALFLFTREKLAIETSSIVVFVLLTIGFEIFPFRASGRNLHGHEFLLGFGHQALIAICALMVLGRALEDTGALAPLARILSRHWGRSPRLAMLVVLVLSAICSAFLNNISIVVMLMPILVAVALRSRVSASGMLMPMGLATLIGGMATTIGTSTNLLVVTIAADLGAERFGMFDFALPVVMVGSVGLIYLWLAAPRLIPVRDAVIASTSPRIFDALLFVVEGSFADGRSLADLLNKTERRMKVLQIERGRGLFITRLPTVVLQPGDRLHLSDTPENLKEFERLLGGKLHDLSDLENPIGEEHALKAAGQQLAELVVTENSPLDGTTLRQARFAERFGLIILALHRKRGPVKGDVGDVALEVGDLLLAQGAESQIAELKRSATVLVLDDKVDLPATGKAPLAIGAMIAVVAAAVSGLLPIGLSALTGAAFVIAVGCLHWQRAANALSTPVILIIVATLALGTALTHTGGADYLAAVYLALTSGLPTPLLLSLLMLLMALITNVVSTNASAVIGTPVAVGIAHQLGASPEPFVLAVLFGVNMSYATPLAHKTNLLILSAGGYTFNDFARVGIPLTLIMWVGFSLALPLLYAL